MLPERGTMFGSSGGPTFRAAAAISGVGGNGAVGDVRFAASHQGGVPGCSPLIVPAGPACDRLPADPGRQLDVSDGAAAR